MIDSALILAAVLGLAQAGQVPTSNPTIRGTVVDARTSAPIADARVTLVEASLSARTGADGRFEFAKVRPGAHTLTVSTIGYIFVRRRVEAPVNVTLDLVIPLAEGTGTYQESVTVAADAAARPPALGVSSQMELGSAGLAELRGVAADDPMRAIQALPGVATGDDFQAEFSVRGSAFRHVGVVMDGTPTPLLLHAVRSSNDAGSIAMINSDILSRGALFAGPHPRPHGDWLGATLEFDVREGSRDRAGVRMAVSGTSASGVFEGPIGRGRRGSWLASIRRSYIDWLIRKLEPDIDSTIGFTDAQLKFAYDLSARHSLQLFVIGGDATYREQRTSLANGIQQARSRSAMAAVTWRYARPAAIVTQRLSLTRATYENRGMVGQHLADGRTSATAWRADVIAPLAHGWTGEAGGRVDGQRVAETLRSYQATGTLSVRLRAEQRAAATPVTAAAWGQMTGRWPWGGLTAGARVVGRGRGQRVVLPWLLVERTTGAVTFRAGAGRSAQFIDPIVDALAPERLAPEHAVSCDASLEWRAGHGLRAQVTGFFRDEDHVLRRTGEDRLHPATGARIVGATFPTFSNTLAGATRGVDVIVARQAASGFSGWIGYTWAHTRYDDAATGESFDGDFDQRHTLNVFAQQRLSYRLAVSAKLRVGSNFPVVGYFAGTPDALRLSTARNGVRLPAYARLDVRANRTFTFTRSRLTLFVEVMNLLGRRNAGQSDGSIRSNLDAVGYVERLLPRVPSAGILIEF